MNPGQSVKDRAGAVHHPGCRASAAPQARRHGGRGHRRQYRHRARAGRQRAGLPHRDRHPRDAEPGEEGRAAPARRRARRGAGRALQATRTTTCTTRRRLAESLRKTEPNGAIWANQWDNTRQPPRPHRDDRPRRSGPIPTARSTASCRAVGSGGTLGGVSDGLPRQRKDIQIALADVPRRGDVQLLHDRRAEVDRRLLDHRRHRARAASPRSSKTRGRSAPT